MSEALASGVDLTMINDDYPLLKNLLDEILEIEITNNTNMPLRPEYRSTVADSGEKATFGSSATADISVGKVGLNKTAAVVGTAAVPSLNLSTLIVPLRHDQSTASPQAVILDGARSQQNRIFFGMADSGENTTYGSSVAAHSFEKHMPSRSSTQSTVAGFGGKTTKSSYFATALPIQDRKLLQKSYNQPPVLRWKSGERTR